MNKNTIFKIMLLAMAVPSEDVFNKTDAQIFTCTLAEVSSVSFMGWCYLLLLVFSFALLYYVMTRRLYLKKVCISFKGKIRVL